MNEVWKRIDNFPNYEISNKGKVRNLKTGKLVKQRSNGKGYPQVDLRNEAGRTTRAVHRLTAEAFIGTSRHIMDSIADDRAWKHTACLPVDKIIVADEAVFLLLDEETGELWPIGDAGSLEWVTYFNDICDAFERALLDDARAVRGVKAPSESSRRKSLGGENNPNGKMSIAKAVFVKHDIAKGKKHKTIAMNRLVPLDIVSSIARNRSWNWLSCLPLDRMFVTREGIFLMVDGALQPLSVEDVLHMLTGE